MQTISKDQMLMLLSSQEFQTLLSEEVSKQLSTTRSRSSIDIISSVEPPKTMQISDMIAEISENLQQIIVFNIKEALEQEYGLLLEESGKMKNEIEDLKEQILKLSIRNTGKNIIEVKPSEMDCDFNDLEQMLDSHSKVGSKEHSKLKKEIDSIKVMLLRFTSGSASVLDQLDPEKKKKIEERIGRLGKDVNELLQNSTDGGNIIESISIEKCMKDVQDVIQRQRKFQTSICDKYETSLKSVWNVITMMENNFEEQRSSVSGDESPAARK